MEEEAFEEILEEDFRKGITVCMYVCSDVYYSVCVCVCVCLFVCVCVWCVCVVCVCGVYVW